MIEYDTGSLLSLVFQTKGSVLPKCAQWALSNALLAIAFHFAWRYPWDDADGHVDVIKLAEGVPALWAGYSTILGVILVFRNNQAYARFWEGATLVNQMRGEWYNAVSSLVAFTSRKEEMSHQVWEWQNLLVRLMSILHCAALLDVCEIDETSLDILDTEGLDPESLRYLDDSYDRVEVCMHWVQRIMVDAAHAGILDVSPPILSRSFQELSRGVVNLNNVKKIRNIPFPFPYTQMLISMLLVHFLCTAFFASLLIPTWYMAGIVSFFVTGGFWSIVYIAREVEQPFGEDANDLPMVELQQGFNLSLMSLLDPQTLRVPCFESKNTRQQLGITGWVMRNTTSKKRSSICSRLDGQRQSIRRSQNLRNVLHEPAAESDSDFGGSPAEETSAEEIVKLYEPAATSAGTDCSGSSREHIINGKMSPAPSIPAEQGCEHILDEWPNGSSDNGSIATDWVESSEQVQLETQPVSSGEQGANSINGGDGNDRSVRYVVIGRCEDVHSMVYV